MMPERKLSITWCKDSKNGVHCLQTNETDALEAPKSWVQVVNSVCGEQGTPANDRAIATCCISLIKQPEILTAKLISKSFNR